MTVCDRCGKSQEQIHEALILKVKLHYGNNGTTIHGNGEICEPCLKIVAAAFKEAIKPVPSLKGEK